MKPHRLLLAATLLAAVVTARAADPAPASAKAPAKTPAARAVENAPENFPLTLRGFFGKGDKVEVSVQDKTSGKSVWLSPGSTHTGWKLESADATTGRAVFSQGTRRVNLSQAVESHQAPVEVAESAMPKLKSKEDSVVLKKMTELLKDPKYGQLFGSLCEKSELALKNSHPEYFNEVGNFDERKPGAFADMSIEMKRQFLEQNSPEAESLKAVMVPLFDASIKIPPYGAAGENPKAMTPETEEREELRTLELADELYRQRNAAK